MEGLTLPFNPFQYPRNAAGRKHGPGGYKHFGEFRPWLEDEFTFRCVYCLKRQRWCPTDVWAVDHLVPQSEAPHLECEYDNLILTCQWCNNKKLANAVPDPVAVAYGNCLQVDVETGEVRSLNDDGEILIRILKLNHRSLLTMRRDYLRNLKIIANHSPEDWDKMMGFPEQLPNLRLKRPWSNSRPEGVNTCYYERKKDLPSSYEE